MGGGTSGSFSFPYSADTGRPTRIYTTNIQELDVLTTAAALVESSYNGETAPDPDTFMADTTAGMTQHRMNIVSATVDALDDEGDFDDFVDKAKEKADASGIFPAIYSASEVSTVHSNERSDIDELLDDAMDAAADTIAGTPFADMQDSYEKVVKRGFMRSMSRMAASMADIGAVNSSAFVFGMASIENEMQQQIGQFASQQGIRVFDQYVQAFVTTFQAHMQTYLSLKGQKHRSRDALVIDGTRLMSSLVLGNVQAGLSTAQLQTEINRIRHGAAQNEHKWQMYIDQEDAMWDFNVYQPTANMLAAAGGAAMFPPKMSVGESVISGAAAGAGIGNMVGGPVGAGIGAGVGAIMGAFK